METNYVPSVGDILLVKGNTWISKAIIFFMKIYLHKKNTKVDFIPSHCATIIDLWGNLMVIEANASGIEAKYGIIEYLEKYKVRIKRVTHVVTPIDYSKTAVAFLMIPHKYDFLNFIYQIILILTGHWIGPKGYKATHRLYCSEYIALLLDRNYSIESGKSYKINPVDIDLMKELETVYQNF
jgi:hypothetical protein